MSVCPENDQLIILIKGVLAASDNSQSDGDTVTLLPIVACRTCRSYRNTLKQFSIEENYACTDK
jgi:hypothetical protein